MILHVDTCAATLTAGDVVLPCRIGAGGACAASSKREGDGCTPLGEYRLRAALLRPDRMTTPITALPWRWLRPTDGWSDDPQDSAYNRPVRHPHPWSAEHIWRDDGAYDVVVVLGYNDAPTIAGAGSAIFLHCSMPDRAATAGCVAITRDQLFGLLPQLDSASTLVIV